MSNNIKKYINTHNMSNVYDIIKFRGDCVNLCAM